MNYYMSGAGEGSPHPLERCWVVAEQTPGSAGGVWWTLVMRKTDGTVFAVRALSDAVPMRSSGGPGTIHRYQVAFPGQQPLEYVDADTGRALIPSEFDFKRDFLPRPAVDARFPQGWATAGTLLGHLVVQAPDQQEPPAVDFRSVRRLPIRTDFIVGTSRTFKDDGTGRELPNGNYSFVQWNQQDYEAMLEAGFNYFGVSTDVSRDWLLSQAAFIRGMQSYPDDLYRANVVVSPMFIDEPMIRLGWSGGVPGNPAGPEVIAEALRQRVMAHYTLRDRVLPVGDDLAGTLDLIIPKGPSWETEYWSAWYQLQAGAPGIVHEGRYVDRGYGWDPETLVGDGLEGLTKTDMFNFYYAFLRGAARSFDGDWGTSIYGQSQDDLRVPAFIQAYNKGARYLWFWTSDHDHHMPFPEQLRLAKAVTDHARQNPRGDRDSLVRSARVGIALPAGYAFSWNGTWGMSREQLNPHGVSYGDISAAMFWEGMIQSRKGVDFDFVVDHPGIEKLGYQQLYLVQEDGSVRTIPERQDKRAPRNLTIRLGPPESSDVAQRNRISAQHRILRAGPVEVDADLSEWQDADWLELGGDSWFGDSFDVHATIEAPQSPDLANSNFFGAHVAQLTEDRIRQYALEAYLLHEDFVVVTGVDAGSPAAAAGFREGDMILQAGGRDIAHTMTLDQIAVLTARKGGTVDVTLRRSGRANYGGRQDLSARVAFMLDDTNLYFAAEVNDDTHVQTWSGSDIWKNDSVQIGIDSILDRTAGNYGENDHEIGFAIKDGKPLVWRWKGRRGQAPQAPPEITAAAQRRNASTFYEASIPLASLSPLAPGVWSRAGINVVVNDSDTADTRKGRLELQSGAMTRGKNPDAFKAFHLQPSGNPRLVEAGLVWETRAMAEGGMATLRLGIVSEETTRALVRADLRSLDDPDTAPAVAERWVPVSATPHEHLLGIGSRSPAGRYELKVTVTSPSGWLAASDALPVYIHPEGSRQGP